MMIDWGLESEGTIKTVWADAYRSCPSAVSIVGDLLSPVEILDGFSINVAIFFRQGVHELHVLGFFKAGDAAADKFDQIFLR
jgi:hypothetical protein